MMAGRFLHVISLLFSSPNYQRKRGSSRAEEKKGKAGSGN